MGADTKIEWADHSWSPWRGCTKVSPGCANCYAETLSKRNPAVLGEWGRGRPRVIAKNWGDPVRWNKRVAPVHCVNAIGDKFTVTVRRPRIFPSLCDWLDDEVQIEWLARFLALIHDTPHLDWLLLTKRPENWFARLNGVVNSQLPSHGRHDRAAAAGIASHWKNGNLPHNVWFGVSVEDQTRADERIPELLEIPARVRWLSVEPLLGPVDLAAAAVANGDHTVPPSEIDWVVVGGESGPKARLCNVEWIRDIVGQCRTANVPCFVKQLGARPYRSWKPGPVHPSCPPEIATTIGEGWSLYDPKGGDPSEWPEDLRVRQFPEVKP